jgi:rod shape-determining protein MreD
MFFVLVLLQVLILNNIQLSGYLNPYLYVLFILLLPFETPGWLVLILGFLLGFSIDIFSNTLGINAAATVAMAFARQHLLRRLAPRGGFEMNASPNIHIYGLWWFVKYSLILILIHHLYLFYLAVFSFQFFFKTLFLSLLNAIVTCGIIVLSQYVSNKK